jgi:hypothetical protein
VDTWLLYIIYIEFSHLPIHSPFTFVSMIMNIHQAMNRCGAQIMHECQGGLFFKRRRSAMKLVGKSPLRYTWNSISNSIFLGINPNPGGSFHLLYSVIWACRLLPRLAFTLIFLPVSVQSWHAISISRSLRLKLKYRCTFQGLSGCSKVIFGQSWFEGRIVMWTLGQAHPEFCGH